MHRARVALVLVLSFGLLAPVDALRAQAPQPYRILINKDDGVRAAGIKRKKKKKEGD